MCLKWKPSAIALRITIGPLNVGWYKMYFMMVTTFSCVLEMNRNEERHALVGLVFF